jgi:hypothetical protein
MRRNHGEIGLRTGQPDRVGSTPTAPHPANLREMIRLYYELPGNGAGGSLHLVLDDGNIETRDITYCRDTAYMSGDWRGVLIANMLLQRTKRGRAKIVR